MPKMKIRHPGQGRAVYISKDPKIKCVAFSGHLRIVWKLFNPAGKKEKGKYLNEWESSLFHINFPLEFTVLLYYKN